jgi:hypothetical protein
MTIPAWEASLPQKLLLDGYGESPADTTIESSMDMGPKKIRRRFTAGVRPVTGNIIVTTTQLATFKTFFTSTLLGGALRFSWTEPPGHTTACEMRFTGVPSWVSLGKLYKISLSLEILP